MNVEPPVDRSSDLGDRTWPDIDQPVLLVPVGSCEQHGPHLPLDTDTTIAVELARRAAARIGALVGPAIAITASGEHDGFPGTLSIGTAVTTQVLIEVARSASWARRIVFVNGHGGNANAIRDALEVCHRDGRHWVDGWSPSLGALRAAASSYPDLARADVGGSDGASDLHAGWIETSVMLFLRPGLVGAVRPSHAITDAMWTMLRELGVRAVSPSGVLGNPAGATAELGGHIISAWTDALVNHLSDTGHPDSGHSGAGHSGGDNGDGH